MKRVAAVVVLLLALVACNRGPSYSPAVARSSFPKGGYQQIVNAELQMRMTGASDVTVPKQRVMLRTVEIISPKIPPIAWFVSVSAHVGRGLNIDTSDGRKAVFTADLAPGLYRGPGTYTLSDKGGTELHGKQSMGSAAYIQLIDITDPNAAERYDRLVEPCTLRVEEEFARGSVRCPKLADEQGRTVALQWDWERV